MLNKQEQKRKAYEFVDFLVDNDYWGEVVWKFEKGNIVHLKLSRGLKLENMDLHTSQVYKAFIAKKKTKQGFTMGNSAKIEEKVETG
jgi:hypothetical protein